MQMKVSLSWVSNSLLFPTIQVAQELVQDDSQYEAQLQEVQESGQ